MAAFSRSLAFALALTSAACSRSPSNAVEPDLGTIALALVDSFAYSTDFDDGILWHVQVAYGGRVDTIPALTKGMPAIYRNVVLYGFRYSDSEIKDIFAYTLRDRRMDMLPLPHQMVPFATPSFSPYGTYLAYFAQDSSGGGYPTVVAWPNGKQIYRGASVTLLPTDVGVDHVQWLDDDHFEILLDIDIAGFAHRVRGSAREPARVVADTIRLRSEPEE